MSASPRLAENHAEHSADIVERSLRRVRVVLALIFMVAIVGRHLVGDGELGIDLLVAFVALATATTTVNALAIRSEAPHRRTFDPNGLILVVTDLTLALAVMALFDAQATPLAWVALALPILTVAVRYGGAAAAIAWLAASAFVIAFRIQGGEAGSDGAALSLGFQQLGAVLVLVIPANYLSRYLRREIDENEAERELAHRRAERLEAVASAAQQMSEASAPELVISLATEGAINLGFSSVDVCERAENGVWRISHTAGGATRPADPELLSEDAVARGCTVSLVPHNSPAAAQKLHDVGFAAGHGVPLWSESGAAVVLRAWSRDRRTSVAEDLPALELLVKQASAAWLNSRMFTMLSEQASRDTLTGLSNRVNFLDELDTRLASGGLRSAAVLFVDLDGFKDINDELGHHVGDEVLIHTAQRFRSVTPAGAVLARFGGDEFVVLSPPTSTQDSVHGLADQIVQTLSKPIALAGGATAAVRASVGVAFAEPGLAPQDLLRRADGAMYQAKRSGGSRYLVWEDADRLDPV